MKIVATKRDDILKARDEYDSKLAEVKDRYENAKKQFKTAFAAYEEDVKAKLKSLLPKSDKLKITINDWYSELGVQFAYGGPTSEGVALSWTYQVGLNSKGEISTESNSWSGLKATSPELIDDLKVSVDILSSISRLNWSEIIPQLNDDAPKRSDYVSNDLYSEYNKTEYGRPNFEAQLHDAAIAAIVGDDTKAVLCQVEREQDPRFRRGRFVWVSILKETASTYIVTRRGTWAGALDTANENDIPTYDEMHAQYEERLRKSSLNPVPGENKEYIIVDLK